MTQTTLFTLFELGVIIVAVINGGYVWIKDIRRLVIGWLSRLAGLLGLGLGVWAVYSFYIDDPVKLIFSFYLFFLPFIPFAIGIAGTEYFLKKRLKPEEKASAQSSDDFWSNYWHPAQLMFRLAAFTIVLLYPITLGFVLVNVGAAHPEFSSYVKDDSIIANCFLFETEDDARENAQNIIEKIKAQIAPVTRLPEVREFLGTVIFLHGMNEDEFEYLLEVDPKLRELILHPLFGQLPGDEKLVQLVEYKRLNGPLNLLFLTSCPIVTEVVRDQEIQALVLELDIFKWKQAVIEYRIRVQQ